MMWKKLLLTEEEGNEYSGKPVEALGGKVIAAKFQT